MSSESMFPKAASHPKTCRLCNGSGWMDSAPVKSQANGDDVVYSMMEPCAHRWWLDDPDVDQHGHDKTTVVEGDAPPLPLGGDPDEF